MTEDDVIQQVRTDPRFRAQVTALLIRKGYVDANDPDVANASQADLFRKWWMPRSLKGVSLVGCDMDVRTGGKYRLEFGSADGGTMAFYRLTTPAGSANVSLQFQRVGAPPPAFDASLGAQLGVFRLPQGFTGP